LKIRPEQMEVFRRAAVKGFIERMMEHLHRYHSEAIAGLSDEMLRDRVEIGVGRGEAYGLTSEDGLPFFVALMFEIAPNFDQQTNIHSLLSQKELPPKVRIELVQKATTADDWEEARKLSDPHVWER
jgi:hypothetical protein